MVDGPDLLTDALQTPEGRERVSVFLRRLDLTLEVAFLTALGVTLCGLLVLEPHWQEIVRVVMPVGLSFSVMRRGWAISAGIGLLSIMAVPLFAGAMKWDSFYILAVLPVWAATGWAHRTHKRAAWRWVATVAGMALSEILIAGVCYPHGGSAILKWSVDPAERLVQLLGMGLQVQEGIRTYWLMSFIGMQVLGGTAIFLLLAFFADLTSLPLAKVPFFGLWKMPPGFVWILLADLAGLVVVNLFHAPIIAPVEIMVLLMLAYGVMGVNVLWRLGQLAGLSGLVRAGIFLLLAVAGWIGISLVCLLGLYDSIWNLRDYMTKLRRPS